MSSATTRVTLVLYVDKDGQKELELPGWGPSVPGIAESGIEAITFLGELLIERPYRDIADGPSELTLVDLWSLDRSRRMVQEFAGFIVDKAEIDELLSHRLGTALTEWKPEIVHYMRKPRAPIYD
jgi:hypothetical protein